MKIQFLRHATFVVTFANKTLLIDPMLSPAEAMEPIANAGNQWRIPLVPLPLSDEGLHALLQHLDAIVVTHTHRDHWDATAQQLLPKQLPFICQPEDQDKIKQAGFTQVLPIPADREWQGIQIKRIGGQHGTGELGKRMAPVSGFILQASGEPSLYIAGDTIWCTEVERALAQYAPNIIVLNTGAASYVTGGGPITMNAEDVLQVCQASPNAQVIAVHMETVNHCLLTRTALHTTLQERGMDKQVLIPKDGALLTLLL